jgi:putative addiction module component (TIGR02574 family)
VAASVKTLGIDRLDIDDRPALVEEIWASICADAQVSSLTEAQRAELDRRVADDRSFADFAGPWSEVKAFAGARVAK